MTQDREKRIRVADLSAILSRIVETDDPAEQGRSARDGLLSLMTPYGDPPRRMTARDFHRSFNVVAEVGYRL